MNDQKELVLCCQPHIYRDRKEPFPIRHIGYTVFREKGRSQSFRDLTLDPAEHGAAFIIEYAVYYDYDIQHMYDLEHAWTAVREDGSLAGCWGTFHGMRLRADGLASFRTEKGCPVLEFPTQEICAEEGLEKTIQAWTKAALRKMQEKGICLLHTANAPEAVEETKRRGAAHGLSDEAVGKRISGVMCRIARSVMEESGCRKLVVAGGDTSAAVTEALKIYRMDMIREIEAGIPLMRGRSALGDIDLVLKSGSFGSEAFLEKAVQAVRRQVGEEQVE